MSEIVFFDLETGGTQIESRFYTDLTWAALHESRRPDVAVACAQERRGIYADQDSVVLAGIPGHVQGILCPAAPIIQVGAVAVDLESWEELEEFELKMGFRRELTSPAALKMNSYATVGKERWREEAVRVRPALEVLNAFLRRHATTKQISKKGNPWYTAQLGGHNAVAFDAPMIRRDFEDPEWQSYALPSDPPRASPPEPIFFLGGFDILDTLRLGQWWVLGTEDKPENLKLETLAEYFGVEYGGHDALGDARTSAAVAKQLMIETGISWSTEKLVLP